MVATFGSTLKPISSATGSYRAVQVWLLVVTAMVFAMIVVGGATRLTGSGLSITEWQPIVGTLPPLSDADWAAAFEKYRQIPQYHAVNKGMSLAAFKGIFWWEWSHRLLGRFIGVAFLVPFLVFLVRGRFSGALAPKLAILFVLGGLQGALGWYMVASGLSGRVDVSQYRLAAHLLAASVLLAALLWTALDVGAAGRRHINLRTLAPASPTIAAMVVALVLVQIGAGALVAGLKAGLAYNTWPLMDGHVVPGGLGAMQPLWRNLFENAATAQFDHRMLAYVVAAVIVWHGFRVIRTADVAAMRRSASVLIGAVALQIALGIWTLLAVVPLHLALAHQAMAMLVLLAAVWHLHAILRR